MTQSEKVNEFVQQIIDGAGWATADYIINFSPSDFNKDDRKQAMKKLAEQDRLYYEEGAVDFDDEPPSKEFLISVEEVENLGKASDINRYHANDAFYNDDDVLSQETEQRMDELTSLSDLRILKDKVTNITKDLKEEGFESKEIQEHLERIVGAQVLYEFL